MTGCLKGFPEQGGQGIQTGTGVGMGNPKVSTWARHSFKDPR